MTNSAIFYKKITIFGVAIFELQDMKQIFKTVAIVATIAIFGIQSLYAAIKCQYVDASTLTIINKAQENEPVLQRLDPNKYEMRKGVSNAMKHSTGIAILFTTDSRAIHAKWSTLSKSLGANMTPVFHSGLDLYLRENGKWIFAGIARPKTNGTTKHENTLVRRMAEGKKECMIYLPMFNGVTSLEIGVDEGATIEPMASPFKYRVFFVGSSLTHGASACRPGASYVARIGRMLNAETPNIGVSGQCKLDSFYADIVCDSKADAFVFDTFSNSTAKLIDERLYNFVKRITAAHPNTPMIFLQTVKRDQGHFDLGARKRNDDQRAAAEKWMKQICKEFKNVYFLNPGFEIGNDGEGTIDGTHLNDLGVQRTIENVVPKMKKILKKYGIK